MDPERAKFDIYNFLKYNIILNPPNKDVPMSPQHLLFSYVGVTLSSHCHKAVQS